MSKNVQQAFVHWFFNDFSNDPLYLNMIDTVEDSPHHREGNVGIHTNMVVASYLSQSLVTWSHRTLLGAFVCAFHDVGKPGAKETVYSEERGHYNRFHGHEQLSARLWEDWAIENWSMLSSVFDFTTDDIYRVGWMIEYHLPWRIKNVQKREVLALSVKKILSCHPFPYTHMLMADALGRICDDDRVGESETWCNEFIRLHERTQEAPVSNEAPVLYMPIAASGAGKSTYVKQLVEAGKVNRVHSWDDLRMEWYVDPDEDLPIKEQYRLAFERQCEDKTFNQRTNIEFMKIIKAGESVVVDNTNLTKKRRRFFVQEAKKHGYRVVALLFPARVNTILERIKTRPDKEVPVVAVRRHYFSLQLPSYGEFHEIRVIDGNI